MSSTDELSLDDLDESCTREESTELEDDALEARDRTFTSVHTLERPPNMDNYRESFRGDKKRPSLMDLVRGRKQTIVQESFETFKNRNLEIIESQLKPSKQESPSQTPPQTPEITLDQDPEKPPIVVTEEPHKAARKKLGWFQGVFLRVVSNLVGVMLYLRIAWVAGQAGILAGCGVVLMGGIVAILTTLSTSAICTNGQIKGGGAYYLISRSLGPEFGGSIGIMFAIANGVGASMYIVGFAETVQSLLRNNEEKIIDDGLWDIRLIGLAVSIPILIVVFLGTGWDSIIQLVLLALFIGAMFDYFIGTFIHPSVEKQMQGVTGYNARTFSDNFLPDFRGGRGFFQVFAVYFPATTDIMAGASISGDLEDPQKAIPLGTLLAIVFTSTIYMLVVITSGATVERFATGESITERYHGDYDRPDYYNLTCSNWIMDDDPEKACKYGLLNDNQIVALVSGWSPLVTAGVIACTMSSAIVSMVSAPKIFQAVCKDKLFPYIDWFAKGYGRNDDPRRAYILTFVICCACIMIAELNAIAPIISNFFLCGYALTNFACFHNSFTKAPGFRPSFKYYNMWVSLVGAALCVVIMFIISWPTALITFFFFALLFAYINYRKPEANWGTSTQAQTYRSALQSAMKFERMGEHVKNYRPQILVLTGNPAIRPCLVDFAHNITKGESLMVCGDVLQYASSKSVIAMMKDMEAGIRKWLKQRRVKSFYNCQPSMDLRQGARSLFQGSASGLGRMRPNIVLIGFKQDWAEAGEQEMGHVNDYVGIIHDAFDNEMGVAILRNSNRGFDLSDILSQNTNRTLLKCNEKKRQSGFINLNLKRLSLTSLGSASKVFDGSPQVNGNAKVTRKGPVLSIINEDGAYVRQPVKEDSCSNLSTMSKTRRSSDWSVSMDPEGKSRYQHKCFAELSPVQLELLTDMNRFHERIEKGFIDVWWLYDDGGLTLLVAYLLTQPRSYLENAKLRVYTLSTKPVETDAEVENMKTMLQKFRITFASIIIIPHTVARPEQDTLNEFDRLIEPFRYDPTEGFKEGFISDHQLESNRDQTWHHLRIAEHLRKHSADASLVVVTVPVPRKDVVSNALYMSWLDMLSRDLPPTLLIRGNQQSVLTFYL